MRLAPLPIAALLACLTPGLGSAQECVTCWSERCEEQKSHQEPCPGVLERHERAEAEARKSAAHRASKPAAVKPTTSQQAAQTPAPNRTPAAPASPTCPAGMAWLGSGAFKLGQDGEAARVGPYCLDVTEVTVGAYGECVADGKCAKVKGGERADHPVVNVDWHEATAYCGWAGKRLPTEEEWEWAARGGERGTNYPWGNEAPGRQLCWFRTGDDRSAPGFGSTCPVGSFPAGNSPAGIMDLAGNVWEWTSSTADERRVSRGGGWFDDYPGSVSAANRYRSSPGSRGYGLGFRCARTP